MRLRLLAIAGIGWLAMVVLLNQGSTPVDPCARAASGAGCSGDPPATYPGPSLSPAQLGTPGTVPSAPPTVTPTPEPTPTPAPITFRDEFGGSRLKAAWGRHWPGFGSTDWLSSRVVVRDGHLRITAVRNGDRWTSGLIDTVDTFEQKYGTFSARIRFPDGAGLWPAFWLAQPQNSRHEVAEIDVMEVCAGPPGSNGGNDRTRLNMYVHRRDGSAAFAARVPTIDLANAWHVYTLSWRPELLTISMDGAEMARLAVPAEIPDMKMAVVIDLAGGGTFCPRGDDPTPDEAVMEVDWLRVTR